MVKGLQVNNGTSRESHDTNFATAQTTVLFAKLSVKRAREGPATKIGKIRVQRE